MSLNKRIVSGFFWSTGGQAIYITITLITNILLARILSPEEFGQMGIIIFFTTVANVFVASGLIGAIIRLPEANSEDFKTVFTFNLSISILLYLCLFISSPFIGDFYGDIELAYYLRVSGIILIINAFQLVNNAILVRNMRFSHKSIYNVVAVALASAFALFLAYHDFGVWSLVVLQITTPIFIVLQFAIFERLFIKLGWNKESFSKLYSFGVNTTISNLLNTAFQNIYNLILGKYFSMSQVGYFYQAQKLQQVPQTVLNIFTQNVLLSGLAKIQHEKDLLKKTYEKFVSILTALVGFITIITYVYSKEIVILLYGEKWINSAFFLQLLIIAGFFYMQEQFNRVIFKVYDKTKIILYLEIVKKLIQAVTIIVGIISKDILILIFGLIFTNIISTFCNYYYSNKIISTKIEIQNLFKVIIAGAISILFCILFIKTFKITGYKVFFTAPFLLVIYALTLQVFRVIHIKKDLSLLLNMIKKSKNA